MPTDRIYLDEMLRHQHEPDLGQALAAVRAGDTYTRSTADDRAKALDLHPGAAKATLCAIDKTLLRAENYSI